MPDQWPRALLRAELREVGYDASGTRSVPVALYQARSTAGRGPVRLIVIDQDAVAEDARALEEPRRVTGAAVVLLAPAAREVREGSWARVIRRPFTIGDLLQAIEAMVPLPAGARRPIDL